MFMFNFYFKSPHKYNFLHLTEDRLDISNNWTWLSELLHWFSNIC